MKLMSLMKMVKGDLGKDEMLELLSQMGVEAEFSDVASENIEAEFGTACYAASLPDREVVKMEMHSKTSRILCLIVMAADPCDDCGSPQTMKLALVS
jgi:hypothetical protein